MKHGLRLFISIVLIGGTILLSGCGKTSASTPTLDANAVYTQAAITVAAKLTQTAASQPTATATPTPEPTSTQMEVTPTLSTPLATTQAPLPTNTVKPTLPDQALWISQSPTDGTEFTPNQSFTMTWRIKNTGSSTWTTQYQFRFYAGSGGRMNASDIVLPKEVKSDNEIDIVLQMRAPALPGDYNSIWVLTNSEGTNFYSVSIVIKVSGTAFTPTSPAPTATVGPTQTTEPTVTPTP